MTHLAYLFEDLTETNKEILIAQLTSIGFSGFLEEDQSVTAYIDEKEFQPALFDLLVEQYSLKYSKSAIEEKNWNELWERNFVPVTVYEAKSDMPFVNIRASFHPPMGTAKYEIEITPKMSFGTGHHATTYGMVQAMQTVNFANQTVIDYGTGTAVLAILAQKMGAAKVLAIDCDEWSIQNAEENLARNGVQGVELLLADKIPSAEKANVVLANINLNILREHMAGIVHVGLPEATFLFSGFFVSDAQEMQRILEKHGLRIVASQPQQQWLVLVAQHASPEQAGHI